MHLSGFIQVPHSIKAALKAREASALWGLLREAVLHTSPRHVVKNSPQRKWKGICFLGTYPANVYYMSYYHGFRHVPSKCLLHVLVSWHQACTQQMSATCINIMALYLSKRHCHFTGTEEHFTPLKSLQWLSKSSSFAVLPQKTEREMGHFYVSCLLKSARVHLLGGIPCYWSWFSSYILHSQVKRSTNLLCILSRICLHCLIFHVV